jgi:hypothetical protein
MAWHFIRSYVVSLAAILALGFLLLVSLDGDHGARGLFKICRAAPSRMVVARDLASYRCTAEEKPATAIAITVIGPKEKTV